MVIVTPIDTVVQIPSFGSCHKKKSLYLRSKLPIVQRYNKHKTIKEFLKALMDKETERKLDYAV